MRGGGGRGGYMPYNNGNDTVYQSNQNRDYQQWGNASFQSGDDEGRRLRSQGGQMFGGMKRERSRSGEKENLRQQF